MQKTLLGYIALGVCASAFAGVPVHNPIPVPAPTPSKWDKEPTAVMGITLAGNPDSIAVCPPYGGRDWRPPTSICIDAQDKYGSRELRSIEGIPFTDMRIRGYLWLQEGKIESVSLNLNHGDYARMREILIAKYGEPTSHVTSIVTSNGGVSLSSETLAWLGVENSIRVEERSGKIDESLIVFLNEQLSQAHERTLQQKTEQGASKL
jgi:hypothetical protein